MIGLGAVGARVARTLAAAGARLTVGDIDPPAGAWPRTTRCRLARAGRRPDRAGGRARPGGRRRHTDRRRGGATLRCAAIAGPANNQLADESVAEDLHDQGIIWVPDYVASAGGVIYASAVEQRGLSRRQALADVDRIGTTVTALLAAAGSPHAAAVRLVRERLPGG